MKLAPMIVIGVVAAGVVGAGAAATLGGAFAGSSYSHPPCAQLPTAAEVTAALDAHKPLVNELKALGRGVSVQAGSPCAKGEDRALVQVTYESDDERDSIDQLLTRRDGFGVPVYLVEK